MIGLRCPPGIGMPFGGHSKGTGTSTTCHGQKSGSEQGARPGRSETSLDGFLLLQVCS